MRPVGSATSSRRDAPGVRDLPLRVAGGRDRAEPRDGDVLLGQRHEEALHAPGAADEDEQQSRRERVQRARVAGLAHAEQPARGERQVVRGLPRGLVDEDEAVHYSCAATCSRRKPMRSSSDISVAKPAAWRCPPPPPARAMTETSMRPSVARSETLRRPRLPSGQLARERGDLGALDRAQVVDDALRVAVLGARETEVLAREAGEGQPARRRSAARGPGRAPAARAWRRACPRRGGGRCRGRRRRRR